MTPAASGQQDTGALLMAECLGEELQAYHLLEQLLAKEESALLEVASDRVAALAAEKEPLVQRLGALSGWRASALRAEGLAPDAAGMCQWIERHPEPHATALAWKNLVSCADRARRRNELNGRLIRGVVHHLQVRLNLLSSAVCANQTYGADGHTRLFRAPIPLAKA